MLSSPTRTGLVFFPAFDWAISPTHPEREERLLYTQDQVFEEGILDIEGLVEFKPEIATIEDIQRVHFCVPDELSVITKSHLISAGGAKTIGTQVLEKNIARGFALVRPPGHHAMRVVHGARGFCNINIEAMMIEYLRQAYGVDRVAIVDTDCHHGDGTQDIYWHDPDTLFISVHQDGRTLYPGSGFPLEFGGPNAAGTTINLPLPPRSSEEGFLYVLENAILPILDEFKPDLIVNSAGQDNHYSDPITDMNFSAHGYAELTSRLKPHIAVLEGGYSIESALPYVNVGIILALAGLDYSGIREPDYDPERLRQGPEITRHIQKVVKDALQIWKQGPGIRQGNCKKGKLFQRDRRIFYDTDQIVESQHETIRACPDCSGLLTIDSESDNGRRIFAIHIPRKACEECRQAGYKTYDSTDIRRYNQAFLQDRSSDQYFFKK
ncbi:MAG: histone deacetylase [Syntrophobacteraceae bacterium]|jgi:acetoin utilization deacetylase AcuC-like enzyme